MADTRLFPAGGYRYLPGVFQYSAGVVAEPGFIIERARLPTPLPLVAGFARIEEHLAAIDRPTQAICACELRSPAPFSETGFVAFNHTYVQTLERWGLYRNGVNPVARTNVAPLVNPPPEVSLYAFSYTVPASANWASFIVAGGGEAVEGEGEYRERLVRYQDLSPAGLLAKVEAVITSMESRLDALGVTWADAMTVNAYTVHDIGTMVPSVFAARGLIPNGLTWQVTRPPVVDIEFEMDVHGPARQIVIRAPEER
ncbi:MAG TPA: hypothetical protein PK691_07840 [Thermomicrobiales bacterium]|nr:hypothetical protein [Thermomicrobiales bacterium]